MVLGNHCQNDVFASLIASVILTEKETGSSLTLAGGSGIVVVMAISGKKRYNVTIPF
jgi:hypothetical protein